MAQVKDIVCGMTVDSETAQHRSEYKGQTYYFCSRGCKSAFDKDPKKYLQPQTGDEAGHRQHGH